MWQSKRHLDVQSIREALNAGGQPVTALKEAVDAFDCIGRNLARQLCDHVLMTRRRRAKWERTNFAQFEEVAQALSQDFDIDLLRAVAPDEAKHVKLMFHRRHLHSHKGGVADRKYIEDSGDSVEEGQLIRETQDSVHRLLSSLVKIARNLLDDFHSIVSIHEEPIKYWQERKQRLAPQI